MIYFKWDFLNKRELFLILQQLDDFLPITSCGFQRTLRLECRTVSPRFWVTNGWSHQPFRHFCHQATILKMHNGVLLRSIFRAYRWQFETCPEAIFHILTTDRWNASGHFATLRLRAASQGAEIDYCRWADGGVRKTAPLTLTLA